MSGARGGFDDPEVDPHVDLDTREEVHPESNHDLPPSESDLGQQRQNLGQDPLETHTIMNSEKVQIRLEEAIAALASVPNYMTSQRQCNTVSFCVAASLVHKV